MSVEEPLIHLIYLFIFVIQFINQQYQSLTISKHLNDPFNLHKLQNILAISEKDWYNEENSWLLAKQLLKE